MIERGPDMQDMKCPFSTVQAAGLAHCALAQQVVRRGGAEYGCTEAKAFARCECAVRHLTAIGLPALGFEDDLTQTPKSAYDKVLLGGLNGIDVVLGSQTAAAENIGGRISELAVRYPTITDVPNAALTEAIQSYTPPRRRGRRA
jgi:hypothetical protein